MHTIPTLGLFALVLAATTALAQNPPLTPTANMVLDTTATQGVFAFSHIDIPIGIVVAFTGNHPVRITCDGNAAIHGWIRADGYSSANGPGGVTTGAGQNGSSAPAGVGCHFGWYVAATDGQHAGVYGSAWPFDLAGGSPGGAMTTHTPAGVLGCPPVGTFAGGGGGGTLVLECGGQLDVHAGGRVTANGATSLFGAAAGSGGSILLRAFGGLTIHAGGEVRADTATPGYIRLDAYAQAPTLLGTVLPTPHVVTLPFLEQLQSPTIGNPWMLRVAAPRGDGVSLATSYNPGMTTNQFGTVYIDLPNAVLLRFALLPTTGPDPMQTLQFAIPNNPAFLGLNLHTAGLDWLTPLPPRFTHTIHSIVQ